MNEFSCHNPGDEVLLCSRWANWKGGLIIGLSPFQRAMIRAALERYQEDSHQETQVKEPVDVRLWINQDAKQISLTEIPNFIGVLLSTHEQRAAVIDSLIEKGFTMIP